MEKGFTLSWRRHIVHTMRTAARVMSTGQIGHNPPAGETVEFRRKVGRFSGIGYFLSASNSTRASVLAFVEMDNGRIWVARESDWTDHGMPLQVRQSLTGFAIGRVIPNAGDHHEQVI